MTEKIYDLTPYVDPGLDEAGKKGWLLIDMARNALKTHNLDALIAPTRGVTTRVGGEIRLGFCKA